MSTWNKQWFCTLLLWLCESILPISFRVTSMAQSNCHCAGAATLKHLGKWQGSQLIFFCQRPRALIILIFAGPKQIIMGIPILIRWCHYIESAQAYLSRLLWIFLESPLKVNRASRNIQGNLTPEVCTGPTGDLHSSVCLLQIGQVAFQGMKTLNRIQSVVYPTAYHSNQNLLICAPTGAGKTNIAMLTIVHEIKQHIQQGVIKKDQFKVSGFQGQGQDM